MMSILVALLFNNSLQAQTSLTSLWRQARSDGSPKLPSTQEIHRATSLFQEFLAGKAVKPQQRKWSELGFLLEEKNFRNKEYLILREANSRREGRGFFLVAPESNSQKLLLIPHSQKDQETGLIGLRLFQYNDFRAIGFNTVPRYSTDPQGLRSHFDLGKIRQSYFAALSQSFATAIPNGKLIQLHGFARDKRTTEAGKSAGFIISGGSREVPSFLLDLRDCLQGLTHDPVLLYPKDVQELGGTTNISGKILRQAGHDGFVHIEMSWEIRQQLKENRNIRKAMGHCLEQF